MDIPVNVVPYIEGSEFHDAFPLTVKQSEPLRERMEFIESLVQGKSVLHIGCLDHVPLIPDRMANNRWFHGRITKAASECLGVDINQAGIDYLRANLNITNVCYGNIEAPEKVEAIASNYWDYAILGEVVEHTDNPVQFLHRFVSTYRGCIGKVIITVPNAFKASNLRMAFGSLEVINSDHRYWFTPYTIWKVAHQAALEVEHIQMCKFDHTGNFLREKVRDFVLRRRPLLAESIVVVCHPR